MTDKELRRLGRGALIEIIYEMKKNEVALTQRLEELEGQLADRTIRMDSAGSIAEASLALNGVFEAAQRAAEDYLRSVQTRREEADALLAHAQEQSKQILAATEREVAAHILAADQEGKRILAEAERAAKEKWMEYQTNVHELLMAHPELAARNQSEDNI